MKWKLSQSVDVFLSMIWSHTPAKNIPISQKSRNVPVQYPTIHHSEQKCAHFCSELGIVGYETGALWDLWIWSIVHMVRALLCFVAFLLLIGFIDILSGYLTGDEAVVRLPVRHRHYSDIMRAISPGYRLFAQPFVQAQIKENIKALRHWPLWGESTGDRWIPFTKGQLRWKCFHLIASSWRKRWWYGWCEMCINRLMNICCLSSLVSSSDRGKCGLAKTVSGKLLNYMFFNETLNVASDKSIVIRLCESVRN